MYREREINKVFVISVVIASVLVITLIGVLVARSSNKAKQNDFAEELSKVDSTTFDSESASTKIGKTVEESEDFKDFEEAEVVQNTENTVADTSTNKVNTSSNDTNTNKTTNSSIDTAASTEENKTEQNNSMQTNAEAKKIDFEAPVKGKILREFAKDSLVFSNTLQEWITHNGVDIKADKTTVVKAAASGTVSSIKNDPRYGLTVIINHDSGYQTIYSNLLTAEFVVKGEKVEKGQTIGTVGNSASFEVADEDHLHLELLQNNEYLDPVIYMNFE